MSIRLLVAGIVAGVIVSSPCFAQDKASQKFLKEAIEGNLAEVQMGQLAEKNGKSDGVRPFGQMLQKDHSEANQKATTAANQMGVSPPTTLQQAFGDGAVAERRDAEREPLERARSTAE